LLPDWVEAGAALDINSFYNCMRLPENWRRYFGFPRVKKPGGGGWSWPVNTTMPMGWTGSVLVGQLVHEELFRRSIARLPEELRGLTFVDLRDVGAMHRYRSGVADQKVIFYCLYIDDLSLFGVDAAVVDAILAGLVREYRAAGFPTKESKLQRAASQLQVLGVHVDLCAKRLRPKEKAILYLYQELPRMAKRRTPVQASEFCELVGKLVWPFLLRRPLLASLSATFAFAKHVEAKGEAKLWGSVRRELRMCFGLLPCVEARLVRMDELVVASDATGADPDGMAGVGVCYSRGFPVDKLREEGWGGLGAAEMRLVSWRVAVSTSLKSIGHVALEEMRALLLAGKVAERHRGKGGTCETLFLVDNSAVVGAVGKGRSGSFELNRLLRQWSARQLMWGWCTPCIKYVNTKWNPADHPSRAYRAPQWPNE
jgi:hypothetical protein